MNALEELFRWLSDPANWSGPNAIPDRVLEHVAISLLSVALASALALPTGLVVGHARKAEFLIVSIANLGRAIPSFAILALALPLTIRLGLGLGFWPTVIALFFLAIPPVLTNAYIGVQQVESDVIEAGRGVGMSERELLLRVELPIASPVVVGGLRTAVVQVIATATLAALVGWGGLGRYILDGFSVRDTGQILGGALLVAALALVAEMSFALIQRAVTPRMDSARKREALRPSAASPIVSNA
jgi:osmoprotectant transport system permease protein